ncbi:DUF58 domain-containing protein [Thermodesulfobacteriota bacterium]
MKRLLFRSFRAFYLVKEWIVRRFTVGGLLVLGGLFVSAVVGLDTYQTVAYQAFTFLFALLMIAVAFSFIFRTPIKITRILPKFGTVSERLVYRVVVDNLSSKSQSGLLFFENPGSPLPTFEEFTNAQEPGEKRRNLFDRTVGYHRWEWLISRKQGSRFKEHRLPLITPNGRKEITLEITPLNRGRLQFSGVTIARPDPFGLFNSLRMMSLRQSILVLPKRYPLPPVRLPGTRKYQSGGVALASRVGDSEEFVSLRDYRPGDPLRKIHWKSWAKTDKPVVKEYQDEFFVRHGLILDTFQKAAHSEIFEEAVSVAASFACTITTQESLLDLMFIGTDTYCFTSGRGLARTDKMLEILASVRSCTDKPFTDLPPLVFSRAHALSGCICIFLAWDEQRKEFIGHLKEWGIPLLVLIVADGATNEAAVDLGPMKDSPNRFHLLAIGKIQEELAKL